MAIFIVHLRLLARGSSLGAAVDCSSAGCGFAAQSRPLLLHLWGCSSMVERFTPMPQLDRVSSDTWAGGCWLSTENREVVGSTPATPTRNL